jgi:hypothetical protein
MITLHSRIVIGLIGIFIILLMFFFVRKKILENFYTLIWIFVGIIFILICIFPQIVNFISIILGIEFYSLGVIAISIVGLGAIILHMSIVISFHQKKIKEFEKRIAIYEQEKKNKHF